MMRVLMQVREKRWKQKKKDKTKKKCLINFLFMRG